MKIFRLMQNLYASLQPQNKRRSRYEKGTKKSFNLLAKIDSVYFFCLSALPCRKYFLCIVRYSAIFLIVFYWTPNNKRRWRSWDEGKSSSHSQDFEMVLLAKTERERRWTWGREGEKLCPRAFIKTESSRTAVNGNLLSIMSVTKGRKVCFSFRFLFESNYYHCTLLLLSLTWLCRRRWERCSGK